MLVMGEFTLGGNDGLPRPVTGVLAQAGQQVEERALTCIGITGKSNRIVAHASSPPIKCP
ncbi:hypothetical protein D3C74_467910 [compost metagenome]